MSKSDTSGHMEARHVHYDCIIAWASGAKIEVSPKGSNLWVPAPHPTWCSACNYRVTPEPKRDVVIERQIQLTPGGVQSYDAPKDKNVRYTFDGETRVLKHVELL